MNMMNMAVTLATGLLLAAETVDAQVTITKTAPSSQNISCACNPGQKRTAVNLNNAFTDMNVCLPRGASLQITEIQPVWAVSYGIKMHQSQGSFGPWAGCQTADCATKTFQDTYNIIAGVPYGAMAVVTRDVQGEITSVTLIKELIENKSVITAIGDTKIQYLVNDKNATDNTGRYDVLSTVVCPTAQSPARLGMGH